jgi:hypothetical protein
MQAVGSHSKRLLRRQIETLRHPGPQEQGRSIGLARQALPQRGRPPRRPQPKASGLSPGASVRHRRAELAIRHRFRGPFCRGRRLRLGAATALLQTLRSLCQGQARALFGTGPRRHVSGPLYPRSKRVRPVDRLWDLLLPAGDATKVAQPRPGGAAVLDLTSLGLPETSPKAKRSWCRRRCSRGR